MAQGQTAAVNDSDWETVTPKSGNDGDWETVTPKAPGLFDRVKSAAHTATEFEKGAVKGVLHTGQEIGNLSTFGLNDKLMNKFNPQGKKELDERLTPHGGAQSAGFNTEQVGEYLVPIPGLEEERLAGGAVKLAERGTQALLKRAATTGVKEGLKAGIVGTAQTGSLKEGAKQAAVTAAVAPPLQELSRAASPLLKKSAQRLYERFLIPGGGAGYNKGVAKEGAEELIKQGQTWLTKGNAVRETEQHVMDANTAIESAEDRLLESMGYAPTGRSTLHATAEPFTEHAGPTIDIHPDTGGVPAVIPKEVARPQTAVGSRLPPADEGATRSGSRIKFSRVGETKQGLLDVKPALRRLESLKQTHIVEGGREGQREVIQGHRVALIARQRLINQIKRLMEPNGMMRADSVIKLRRQWDALVDWEKNPQAAQMKPGIKVAFEETANALRHEIGEQVPGMKEANAQYHFWSGINKIFKDKENQTVGHRVLGPIGTMSALTTGAAGYLHSGRPDEALAIAALTGVASKLSQSGAALTGSAVALDRMGQAMSSRKYQAAVNWLARAGSMAARSDSKKPDSGSLAAPKQ